MMLSVVPAIVAVDTIAERIVTLREQRALLDADLAALYSVTTKRFNEAVKRNSTKFPTDFMFQISREEWAAAIELPRKNPDLFVVTLQPCTVRSQLSAPYAAGVSNLLEPRTSVAGILQGLSELSAKRGAHFIDHRGLAIPW